VSLSTHYFVLSLGAKTSKLFEAFRDSLIDVENQGFPVVAPAGTSDPPGHDQLQELARSVDECFGHYYTAEPLKLIVVGEKELQSAFSSVSAYKSAVIGRIEGDHTATPARDLGQIVWSLVKEAMSGFQDKTMRDLEASTLRGRTTSGLEAVARLVIKGVQATLLVEDGYHVKGSIVEADQLPVLSPDIDVREVIDDAVDAVIEKVLESGGDVVFTPTGSLSDRNRIVLLLRGEESTV
jgi:hypothetical protein